MTQPPKHPAPLAASDDVVEMVARLRQGRLVRAGETLNIAGFEGRSGDIRERAHPDALAAADLIERQAATITAMQSVPGWQMVPVEPTKAMVKAAAKAMSPGRRPTPDQVSVYEKHAIRYRAMLSAAPIPPLSDRETGRG